MKKSYLLTTLVVTIITVAFSSCRKCEICTKESEPEVRICEGDYGTKTEYGLAIDAQELLGYECR